MSSGYCVQSPRLTSAGKACGISQLLVYSLMTKTPFSQGSFAGSKCPSTHLSPELQILPTTPLLAPRGGQA